MNPFTLTVMDVKYAKNIRDPKAAPGLPHSSVPALEGVLFIPNMKRYDRLKQQEIRYIKGEKSHVTLHLASGQKLCVSTHLGHFMRYLDTRWFVRTSRSYIVNLYFVEAVTSRSLLLHEQTIPLTEAYRSALWERLPIVHLKSD